MFPCGRAAFLLCCALANFNTLCPISEMLNVARAQMNVDVILVLREIYFNVQMQPLQRPLLIGWGLCAWLSDSPHPPPPFRGTSERCESANSSPLPAPCPGAATQHTALTIMVIKTLCARQSRLQATRPFTACRELSAT